MKVLFNKDNPHSGELQQALGFNDADIDIAKIWPYLRTASRDVAKIIGNTNYQICEEEFDNPSGDFEKEELLELVQYAIALDGFRKYAPLTDLSFTNDGRLFRRDDHQVAAFEWQINKSDEALEKSYYSAVDVLIDFIKGSDTLADSEYMQQYTGLYVPNLDEFQKFVNLNNSHLLYFKLAPSLQLCEQRELVNRMGQLFNEYKLPIHKHSYITNLVKNCCVYFAMADGVQKLSVQLLPEGLMKHETNNRKAASGYDRESVTLYYKQELESLFKSLETEVKKLKNKPTEFRPINFSEDDGFVTL